MRRSCTKWTKPAVGRYMTAGGDPQFVFEGLERRVRVIRFGIGFAQEPGEMDLYYCETEDEAFSPKKRVWGALQEDGSYLYELPAVRVARLRIDPGTVAGNEIELHGDMGALVLNPRLPYSWYNRPKLWQPCCMDGVGCPCGLRDLYYNGTGGAVGQEGSAPEGGETAMSEAFIPLSVPNFAGNEKRYVEDAVVSEWVSTGGSKVGAFEDAVAAYLGCAPCGGLQQRHQRPAPCVFGGGRGHRPGGYCAEPLRLFAAVNPIRYVGAQPVLLAATGSWCIDPAAVEAFLRNQV